MTDNSNHHRSVFDEFEIIQNKDFEEILLTHQQHVIKKRDEIYGDGYNKGITKDSNVIDRLDIIAKFAKYCYYNIEPPNLYTKQTDRRHFREVAVLSVEFWKERWPDIDVPCTLIVSSWFHDIERYIPQTKCKYLHESVDKYRKQLIHPVTSANVAMTLLHGAPLKRSEMLRIFEIIKHHEKPLHANVILDGKELLPTPPTNIENELELLIAADSLSFFQSTIIFFIEDKCKSHSKEWIGQRIISNVNRLRPNLRPIASELVLKLSSNLKDKISIDWNYLHSTISNKNITKTTKSSSSSKSSISTRDDMEHVANVRMDFIDNNNNSNNIGNKNNSNNKNITAGACNESNQGLLDTSDGSSASVASLASPGSLESPNIADSPISSNGSNIGGLEGHEVRKSLKNNEKEKNKDKSKSSDKVSEYEKLASGFLDTSALSLESNETNKLHNTKKLSCFGFFCC